MACGQDRPAVVVAQERGGSILVRESEQVQTIVIGGGQAGLSTGYHLARRGLRFLILEANARIGDSWRSRWDSLRLFTPARFDGIAGTPFPAPTHSFPTKDEMADWSCPGSVDGWRLGIQAASEVRRS